MTAFLLFFGRGGASEIERRLDTVKIAIGAVVLARARDAGFTLYAVTNDEEAAAAFRAGGAQLLSANTNPFHSRSAPEPARSSRPRTSSGSVRSSSRTRRS